MIVQICVTTANAIFQARKAACGTSGDSSDDGDGSSRGAAAAPRVTLLEADLRRLVSTNLGLVLGVGA